MLGSWPISWTLERRHLQAQDANHVLRDGALAHALNCRSLQVGIHFRIWVDSPFGLQLAQLLQKACMSTIESSVRCDWKPAEGVR